MRKLLALVAAAVLAVAVAGPVAGLVGGATIYDGDSQTGALCGSFNADVPNLGSAGGCGNWDNRAESIYFQHGPLPRECIALFTGTSYSGTLITYLYGSQNYEISSTYDNTLSSFYFGDDTITGGGFRACVDAD
jgi:hypothetical protein